MILKDNYQFKFHTKSNEQSILITYDLLQILGLPIKYELNANSICDKLKKIKSLVQTKFQLKQKSFFKNLMVDASIHIHYN